MCLLGLLVLLIGCGSDAATDGGPRMDGAMPPTDAAQTDGAMPDSAVPDAAVSDAATEVDSGPPPPPGGTGTACERNSDCPSDVCLPVGSGNVCTTRCASDAACVAGWTCGAIGGVTGDVCQCSSSSERSDGADNDCDSYVDESGTGTCTVVGTVEFASGSSFDGVIADGADITFTQGAAGPDQSLTLGGGVTASGSFTSTATGYFIGVSGSGGSLTFTEHRPGDRDAMRSIALSGATLTGSGTAPRFMGSQLGIQRVVGNGSTIEFYDTLDSLFATVTLTCD